MSLSLYFVALPSAVLLLIYLTWPLGMVYISGTNFTKTMFLGKYKFYLQQCLEYYQLQEVIPIFYSDLACAKLYLTFNF